MVKFIHDDDGDFSFTTSTGEKIWFLNPCTCSISEWEKLCNGQCVEIEFKTPDLCGRISSDGEKVEFENWSDYGYGSFFVASFEDCRETLEMSLAARKKMDKID